MDIEIRISNNQLLAFNHQVEQALAGTELLSIGPLKVHIKIFHFNIQPANCSVVEHEHPYYEISFMRRGGMTNFTEFGNAYCTPDNGIMFFVPPATLHRRNFSSSATNINSSFMLTFSAENKNGAWLTLCLPELIIAQGCQFALTAELVHILKLLDQQIFQATASAHYVISSLLKTFLLLFFQKYFPELFLLELPATPLRQLDFNHNRFLAIKAFVERSFNGNIPLNDCEESLGLSMRHLNRIFHENCGLSMRQYLVRRQLETAEILLLNSNRSIAEIAKVIHFESSAHFSRFFHHHRGVSPTEFRRIHLIAPQEKESY